MPVVLPAEIWRESGRWDSIGPEMLRAKDRAGREICLAMTNEESIVSMVRNEVRSYRDLPKALYQIRTKFRDEPRPRAGLIRVREFEMKDAYSFHRDAADLDRTYASFYAAYERIFRRCGLDVLVVESDPGMMGGDVAHEFMAPAACGEDTVLRCPKCAYAANRQVATFRRDDPSPEAPRPVEKVPTPGASTIEAVAAFLGVPADRTCKAVFYWARARGLVFVAIRGDLEVSESKLAKAIGDSDLRPARDDEIRASGAVPGYASPIGVRDALVVADLSVRDGRNLVAGANEEGFHLKNVNLGRDFEAAIIADVAAASAGNPCPRCGAPLDALRAIEVGNIFKLMTRYSAAMRATFQDEDGTERPFVMGCYGIGSGRVMAAVVEQNHDGDGIIWPAEIAPYRVSVVPTVPENLGAAERIYEALWDRGVDAVLDDRDLRPGPKFKDADLVGYPARITVGKGLAKGLVEVRDRRTKTVREVGVDEALEAVIS